MIKLLLAGIILFFAISTFYPAYWNWSTFKVYGTVPGLIFLGIIFLIAMFTPLSRVAYRLLSQTVNRISEILGNLPAFVSAFLWIVIPAVLFYMLKTNSYVLGDGDIILRNITNRSETYPSIYGFGIALNKLADLFAISSKAGASRLLSFISIIGGILFLFFVYKTINLVARNDSNKNVTFLLIATSSIIVLFAGYIESYPVLAASLSIYIYYSLIYLRGKGSGIGLILIFSAGLFWHLWFIVFLPSLFFLFNERLKKIPGKIFALLTGFYLIGIYIGGQIVLRDGRYISLPIFPSNETSYTLFSLAHLIDFANELIIIGPAFALISILLITFFKQTKIKVEGRFLLFAAIPALVMSFFIDPIIGAVRDWDLLSIFGLPLMILGFVIFISLTRRKPALAFLIPGIFLLNIFNTSSFIINNKNPRLSVDRVINTLMEDPHYQNGYYGATRNTNFAVILANEYQRYPDAIAFLKKRVDSGTSTVNDIYLLANYSYFAQRYRDCAMLFDIIKDKVQFSPEERFGYGYSLYSTAEYSRAIEQFKYSLEDTCISEAALYAASSFAHGYQLDSCKKYCDLSIECSQDPVSAMHNIVLRLPGWIFPRLKAQYETRVLAVYPDSLEIRNILINLFKQAGMPDSADFYENYRP